VSASTGYDNDMILEKTRLALLKVKNGEAAYERDSVVFEDIQYAWPLLAGLLWVAAALAGLRQPCPVEEDLAAAARAVACVRLVKAWATRPL